MFTLREYQENAEKDILKFIKNKNQTKAVLVSPVASGKSLYTGLFSKYTDKPTLVLQPNKELLLQNFQKAKMYGLNPTIFSASAGSKEVSDLVFATPGTVKNAMHKFKHIEFVCWDEAHLAGTRSLKRNKISSVSQTEKIINQIKPKKVLGLTATPLLLVSSREGSKLRMINRTKRSFFNGSKIIHTTQISDIAEKYWADVEHDVSNNYDMAKLKLNSSGNDFTDRSIMDSFKWNNGFEVLKKSIDQVFTKYSRRNVLVFAPSVEVAKKLEDGDDRITGLYSDTPDKQRKQIIQDFTSGKIKVLVNYGILTTGFDMPTLEALIDARPTNSFTLYYQMYGRIVRLHPSKRKKLYIDLSSNFKRFGDVRDVKFKEIDTLKGWCMVKKDRVMTGFPITKIGNYPSIKEVVRYNKKNNSKFGSKKKAFGRGANNELIFFFGKYKGKTPSEVAKKDKGYLNWLINNDDFKWHDDYLKRLRQDIRDIFIKDIFND